MFLINQNTDHSDRYNQSCRSLESQSIIYNKDDKSQSEVKYRDESENTKRLVKLKLERRANYDKRFSAKKPVYENCKICAPNGDLLAYCDKKKANWYLDKGLANILSQEDNETFTIKLNFEPNTRGRDVTLPFEPPPLIYYNEFYVQERANVCVVCGLDKNYQRFSVIAKIYR